MLTLIYFLIFIIVLLLTVLALIYHFAVLPRTGIRIDTVLPTVLSRIESSSMDPIIFLGLLSSIITITSALRDAGQTPTKPIIRRQFDDRARVRGSVEEKLRARPDQVDEAITMVIAIDDTDRRFLDRIKATCLEKFDEEISNHSELDAEDVREAYEVARNCVCTNLSTVRRLHGGRLPHEFKELSRKYNCGAL